MNSLNGMTDGGLVTSRVDLGDAAPLQIFDLPGIDVVSRDEAVHDLGRQLVAADVGERAVLLADWATDGVDDERVGSSGHDNTVPRGA